MECAHLGILNKFRVAVAHQPLLPAQHRQGPVPEIYLTDAVCLDPSSQAPTGIFDVSDIILQIELGELSKFEQAVIGIGQTITLLRRPIDTPFRNGTVIRFGGHHIDAMWASGKRVRTRGDGDRPCNGGSGIIHDLIRQGQFAGELEGVLARLECAGGGAEMEPGLVRDLAFAGMRVVRQGIVLGDETQ